MPDDATPRMSATEYLALEGQSTSERKHQEAVIEWCEAKSAEVPELSYLFAIPNGQMRTGTVMEPGMKSGVPDLCLPVPRHGPAEEQPWKDGGILVERWYHALYIELKKPGGTVREEQREWIEALREQGYKAEVCYGAEEAIETLEQYLGIE